MPRPIGTIDMHRGRWRVRLTLPDGTRKPFLAPEGCSREQAEEMLRALADGDGVRVEQLALRLATAVLRERAETTLEEVGT